MKITRISIYKTHLPYVGGEFTPCGENYMVTHFAATTPEEFLINSTDIPGLGVEPDFDSVGDPIAVYEI